MSMIRSAANAMRERWSWATAAGLLVVAAVGGAWACYALGPTALDTRNLNWVWGDLAQVYVAWAQYLSDPDARWLSTSRLSYPLPMSISLFDPMPILLLLARPFSGLVGQGRQFFGYYFVLCLVLQGVFGYLAAHRALKLVDVEHDGLTRYIATIVGILFATVPFTFFRFQGHAALSSQWVLALAVWIGLATLDSNRRRWLAANCAVLILATGLNPYLALLVAISNSILVTACRWRREPLEVVIRVAALACTAAIGLSLFGFMGASGAETGGYGMFSMNMLGPMDSNGMAGLLSLDVVDPTGGQSFEGFTYLGLGILLLSGFTLFSFVNYRAADNRFPFKAALLIVLCCCVLAMSATLTLSSRTLELPIPDGIRFLLSRFRGSGRLFWMAGFWWILVATCATVLRLGALRAAALLSLILIIQLVDIRPIASNVRNGIATASSLRLTGVNASGAEALLVYPPWQCDHESTPGGVRNYELVGFFALSEGLVTNSFYAARTTSEQKQYHCDYGARLAKLSPGAIYLLSGALYEQHRAAFAERFACEERTGERAFWTCTPKGRK